MLKHAGVTLIELMVGVGVLAVAASLAAPGIVEMQANSKVRSVAEGMVVGLGRARSEAVRRNSPVRFSLGSGGSWSVAQVASATDVLAQTYPDPSGVTVATDGTATSVTFLANGLVQGGTQLRRITVAGAANGADTRRIDVFGGGLVRMCDPSITTAGDPKGC